MINSCKLHNNIIIKGKLRKEEWIHLSQDYDIFINTTNFDNHPVTLLEAMAHKKCCVVSNIPQNTELVKHKKNGFIFNPKDELDIAEKIEKAYNHKDLNEMGLASYNIVKEKYDINIVAELYDDFMNKMIKINYK